MRPSEQPFWQLPLGVTRGLWQYVHSEAIADDYDEYFAENRLFDFDEHVIASWLDKGVANGPIVADLGCGTGRALIPLARRGFLGLAIDLSPHMLEIVRDKADSEDLRVGCVRANLVELEGVADGSVDHAISMFSTLGMIQGHVNRHRALGHACRILRPNGLLIFHVHNFWYNLRDPGGPWWVLGNLPRLWLPGRLEAGDKFFPYRGVPNMYLHVFRRRELSALLRRAGFQVERFIPLDARRCGPLRWPWLLGGLRANGWIVISRKATA